MLSRYSCMSQAPPPESFSLLASSDLYGWTGEKGFVTLNLCSSLIFPAVCGFPIALSEAPQ